MEAFLGLAASAAGFASLGIQIGGIIIRLKEVWDKIKHSGDEIRYLIEELETLSLILYELGDRNDCVETTPLPNSMVEKSLALCRKGTGLLSEILVDLDQQISKRRLMGGLKATLKASTIAQLRDRLSNARSLLMLSYQIYSELVASFQLRLPL
jgi:hypothetical protein